MCLGCKVYLTVPVLEEHWKQNNDWTFCLFSRSLFSLCDVLLLCWWNMNTSYSPSTNPSVKREWRVEYNMSSLSWGSLQFVMEQNPAMCNIPLGSGQYAICLEQYQDIYWNKFTLGYIRQTISLEPRDWYKITKDTLMGKKGNEPLGATLSVFLAESP